MPAIQRIYNREVLEGVATLDEWPWSDARRRAWLETYRDEMVIVAQDEKAVLGFAYCTPMQKFGFRFTREVTVYVDRDHHPQHRVVQRLVGDQPFPPAVLTLQILQALGLVHSQPAVRPAPAVVGRLGHAEAPRHRRNRFPLPQRHLRLPPRADDLLRCVPLAGHADSPRPARILSLDLDQFWGGRSPVAPEIMSGRPPKMAVRFAPLVWEQLRAKRRGRAGVSWSLDETSGKVGGRWCSLDRAIDHRGDRIDSMLSERRDKHAARRFLRRLVEVAEGKPARITTDLHPAYRRAIRWIIGRKAWHRTTQYLNNYTEQSHRGVKQRYYPMLGFGSFQSASRFCAAFDALRQYFRVRHRGEAHVPLAVERRLFLTRWRSLIGELATA